MKSILPKMRYQFSVPAALNILGSSFFTPFNQTDATLAPVSSVHDFTPGTWLENLRVRKNGEILVTWTAPEPAIYQINASSDDAALVAKIPDLTSVSGIAEGLEDVFYVNALNLSLDTLQGQKGSNSIWELNLWNFDPGTQIVPKLVLALPDAGLLNGLAVFDATRGIYFTADFQEGKIYRADVQTGNWTVALADQYTARGPEGAADGLAVHESFLYFTGNGANVLARAPLDNDGHVTGPTEVILPDYPSDDLTFDRNGNLYLTYNTTAVAVLRHGSTQACVIADGLTNPTAVRFGRTRYDEHMLYVISRGSPSVPGRLSRIDLRWDYA